MSDNSESFEEWFNHHMGSFCTTEKERGWFLGLKSLLYSPWNHQQKKIDDLEKKVTELSWDGALNRAEEELQAEREKVAELEDEIKLTRDSVEVILEDCRSEDYNWQDHIKNLSLVTFNRLNKALEKLKDREGKG